MNRYSKKIFFESFVNTYLYLLITKSGGVVTLREIAGRMGSPTLSSLYYTERVSPSSLSEYLSTVDIDPFMMLLQRIVVAVKDKISLHKWSNRHIEIFDTVYLGVLKRLADDVSVEVPIRLTLKINAISLLPLDFILDLSNSSDNSVFMAMVCTLDEGKLFLFDRGFTSLAAMREIAEGGNFFVTRMVSGYKTRVVESLNADYVGKTFSVLKLIADELVLVGADDNEGQATYRRITFEDEDDGKKLVFLTNLVSISPWEVAQLYRLRWIIEILFRWLKHLLGAIHLISRNWNGIMVQILLTLVLLALLVMLHVMRYGRNKKISLTGAMRIAECIVESWIIEIHPP